MKILLKVVSYLFHPVFIPFFASMLYFAFTARFFPEPLVKAKLLAIAIITIFIPVVFFFFLKTLGLVKNIFLETAKERFLPLLLYVVLIYFLILKIIFDVVDFRELYFFFMGVLCSIITCLVLAVAKFKISLHMVGITGLTMFLISLSIHFKTNLLDTIAFLLACCGLVATARLYSKSHNYAEILFGIFIGFLPQLLLLEYWL